MESPSNVTLISRAIFEVSSRGVQQIVYYQKGVGSSSDVIERIPAISGLLSKTANGHKSYLDAAFGNGLEGDVQAGYGFIAHNYNPEPDADGNYDEIYLFGFSRGAYTARSIGGLISQFGVLDRRGMDGISKVYTAYKDSLFLDNPSPPLTPTQKEQVAGLIKDYKPAKPRIRCIGVWETVGSLGVPDLYLLGLKVPLDELLGDPNKKYQFHNTNLHSNVDYGFHAYILNFLF
jgi:uncharacterized protein (DUF2235 family)